MTDTEYHYEAEVDRWVDGDTVDLIAILDEHTTDFGFRVYEYRKLWTKERFRLAGMDTPERGQPNHDEATRFAFTMAPPGAKVLITSYKPLQDKYGRWLASVMPEPIVIRPDGSNVSVNQALVEAGLAKPYFGGTK